MDILATFRDWLDYDWLRAGHIISVVAWMAGLLMYPRLLIYRLEGEGNTQLEAAMDKAAVSLRKIILTPSMLLAWGFGGLMIWKNWDFLSGQPWFWMKIVLVSGITWIHHVFLPLGRKIARGERPVSPKRLRLLNELPFILAILAIIMVVAEPFSR